VSIPSRSIATIATAPGCSTISRSWSPQALERDADQVPVVDGLRGVRFIEECDPLRRDRRRRRLRKKTALPRPTAHVSERQAGARLFQPLYVDLDARLEPAARGRIPRARARSRRRDRATSTARLWWKRLVPVTRVGLRCANREDWRPIQCTGGVRASAAATPTVAEGRACADDPGPIALTTNVEILCDGNSARRRGDALEIPRRSRHRLPIDVST